PVIPAPTSTPTTPTTPTTTTPVVANSEARDFAQYTELQWGDDFSGSGAPDQTKWGYDLGNNNGWGNHEFETYTNSTDNVSQSGGNLVIQALKQGTAGSYNYTSGRILTKGKQNFQFGRIDVRAKIPQGIGIWPAIWMLGSDIDSNNWPKCGEIDIVELRGQTPTEILTTMHYADNSGNHKQGGIPSVKLPANENFANDFHLYSVIRSQNQIRFYLDGQLYYTYSPDTSAPYPFNNNFFVVLNVAVGGDFLSNPDSNTIANNTTFPKQMLVDYVKYYQYKE
ncbi:MAG: glycoside hydrolase family 16 protein, partial [Hymenobacter sp.]